jgi:hypothetical protein
MRSLSAWSRERQTKRILGITVDVNARRRDDHVSRDVILIGTQDREYQATLKPTSAGRQSASLDVPLVGKRFQLPICGCVAILATLDASAAPRGDAKVRTAARICIRRAVEVRGTSLAKPSCWAWRFPPKRSASRCVDA